MMTPWTRPAWWPAHWMWHSLPEGDEYDTRLQSVVNALMDVREEQGRAVLTADPDYNELPPNAEAALEDDTITQVGVVRLAMAALATVDGDT